MSPRGRGSGIRSRGTAKGIGVTEATSATTDGANQGTATAVPYSKPRWARDLARFLPLKSQFVLSGNVLDLQACEIAVEKLAMVPLQVATAKELFDAGYKDVLSVDCVRGPVLLSPTGASRPASEVLTRIGFDAACLTERGLNGVGMLLDKVAACDTGPIALIVDFASRLVTRGDSLSRDEHSFFTRAQLVGTTAQRRPHGAEKKPYYNTIVWIVDKEGDLPDWLLLGNPKIRHIPVPKPDHVARRAVAPALLRTLPAGTAVGEEVRAKAMTDFVDETEGLLLADLQAICQLGRSEGLSLERISDAVRRYKVGVTDDPWQKIDRAKIRGAKSFIAGRVKGQDHAVTHALDIIKRAITGIGGAKRGGRPRGVAFFAGPTGVGKTELAKTITQLLFGDDSAYIRFDMSEFSAEHADQRLIGAPPGYVGYDVGGELTNAVREKPFSVILFDEIEKAHPRILDKFLQVLDDGVLTSGRGDRVYFSEAFILFTSNLGIYRTDASGERVPNVSSEEPADAVAVKVRSEIDRYFKVVLNRPEILNRIGENIIVFDFIRPAVAIEIFDQMVHQVLQGVEQQGIEVTISPAALDRLRSRCLKDLSNGGRGIRNQVEAHLVNPLARALFDANALPGSRWKATDVAIGDVTSLTLSPG